MNKESGMSIDADIFTNLIKKITLALHIYLCLSGYFTEKDTKICSILHVYRIHII